MKTRSAVPRRSNPLLLGMLAVISPETAALCRLLFNNARDRRERDARFQVEVGCR